MTVPASLRPGQILSGPFFNEPMRVETVSSSGACSWEVGLVGVQTERFGRLRLTAEELAQCSICEKVFSYDGDGKLLRLGLQAYLLGIAYEFDPYFGLSVSKVDPLPHQLEAVYDYLLKLPRVRFLLADDAGAGKTIMAGLLIRELRLRGLAERILVVCPANLCFQWQRELKEKFDEKFLILKGGDIREQFGVNQWLEQKKIITSLDLAKRTEILPGLRQVLGPGHCGRGPPHVLDAAGPEDGPLCFGRIASGVHRPHAVIDRHAAQRISGKFPPFPATVGPGRLCGRSFHPRGHGAAAGAVLFAPYQGGHGLFPRTEAGRHLGSKKKYSPSVFRTRWNFK